MLKGQQSAAEAAFPLFRGVMRSLGLREAFDIMSGLVLVTLRGVSDLPSSFDEIAQFVGDLLTGTRRIWDNFIHFVQRVGADLLVRMGFDEGSELIEQLRAANLICRGLAPTQSSYMYGFIQRSSLSTFFRRRPPKRGLGRPGAQKGAPCTAGRAR